MTFATTTYPPAPGCHATGRPWGDPEPCPECGGPYYAPEHATVEVFTHDVELPGPGWYCVECSDNNGRDWATNGLRWARIEDAARWGGGLVMRWFGMTDCRIRACDGDGEPTGEPLRSLLDHSR